jgi:hypothetical protein
VCDMLTRKGKKGGDDKRQGGKFSYFIEERKKEPGSKGGRFAVLCARNEPW